MNTFFLTFWLVCFKCTPNQWGKSVQLVRSSFVVCTTSIFHQLAPNHLNLKFCFIKIAHRETFINDFDATLWLAWLFLVTYVTYLLEVLRSEQINLIFTLFLIQNFTNINGRIFNFQRERFSSKMQGISLKLPNKFYFWLYLTIWFDNKKKYSKNRL